MYFQEHRKLKKQCTMLSTISYTYSSTTHNKLDLLEVIYIRNIKGMCKIKKSFNHLQNFFIIRMNFVSLFQKLPSGNVAKEESGTGSSPTMAGRTDGPTSPTAFPRI